MGEFHRWITALSLLGLLTACTPPPAGSEISGTVSISGRFQALGSAGSDIGAALSPTPTAGAEDFVPGELIVRFRPGALLRQGATLQVDNVQLGLARNLALADTQLLRAPGLDKAATLRLLQSIQGQSGVLYAQLNYIRRAFKTPNDPLFPQQWHFPAIHLPQAWEIETGASNPVTVAVIDTGILRGHPDFQGKLWPGYDFISHSDSAGDGDGRDSNPEDPPGGRGGYHGSHVAGIAAAATNQRVGVAGVSWGARLLPVRVLGVQGGGTDADIFDGILWATGLSVSGVPNNPNPAQVINMSLGGSDNCALLPAWQQAIDRASARGSIIVAAAGNSNTDASQYTPASCNGVITVGATDARGHRATYSNHGPRIDVMAPGGDISADANNDTRPDGVLSAIRDDATQTYAWSFKQGTSMAAPHVAGLVALMKSRKPHLTSSEALAILKQTARPLTAEQCQRPQGSDCGAGLVDAGAALRAIPGLQGARTFACYLAGPDRCDPNKSRELTLTQDVTRATYRFGALPGGEYLIYGWKDVNQNSQPDSGDYLGCFTRNGQVAPVRPSSSGVDFRLELLAAGSGQATQNCLSLVRQLTTPAP
jgi:serine protease